jgi:glutamine amidotransferase
MCRVLAYLGAPISLEQVLYETDSSLVRQSYSPRMMATFLNLAGFGMIAWDGRSIRPEEPFLYRVTTLPVFDRNLRGLASKLAPTCLVAHVRGVTYSGRDVVAETNLHPFRFEGARVALAHNGHLREFGRMRYDLVEHVRPELVQRIEGTTDSEWLDALVLP